MHNTSRQPSYCLPSLGLQQVLVHGGDLMVALGKQQGMRKLFSRSRQTPRRPMGNCQSVRGASSFSSLHTDAVASGVQQCVQKCLRCFAGFGRNQVDEPQNTLLGQVRVQSLVEGAIHFDNHSLLITVGGGDRSEFEDGTKARFCTFCCGKI